MPSSGWTPIANRLLEAICISDLSGRESRIVLAVMRETYGREPYSKTRQLASSRLEQITGIASRKVRQIVRDLESRRVLKVERHGYRTLRIGINTKTDQWKRRSVRPPEGPNHDSARGGAEQSHSARGGASGSAPGGAYIKKQRIQPISIPVEQLDALRDIRPFGVLFSHEEIRCWYERRMPIWDADPRISDTWDRARAEWPLVTRNDVESAVRWIRVKSFDSAREIEANAKQDETDDISEFAAAWNAAKMGGGK